MWCRDFLEIEMKEIKQKKVKKKSVKKAELVKSVEENIRASDPRRVRGEFVSNAAAKETRKRAVNAAPLVK